ncbi:MAG TPA: SpoIIE family protein phosphatase [Candidatus Baltobacteraceae bacterium]|nr:SpoIIE family protein phosphatase [Candidatus Baltobacteraceae bacterium]
MRGADGGGLCGDAVATRELNRERIALVVVDVLGCGSARAARSASIAAHLVALLALELPPCAALRRADRELRLGGWENDLPPLTTIFAGVLDARAGRLRYASAAHETALLISAGGAHRHLPCTGPVAGLFFDAAFGERDVPVSLGDTLVAVTDGVADSRADGAFFGSAGTYRTAVRALTFGADPARAIVAAARRHATARRDDAAALVARITA